MSPLILTFPSKVRWYMIALMLFELIVIILAILKSYGVL